MSMRLLSSGFAEVLVRPDNELPVLVMKESTATASELAGATVKMEESALYDSQEQRVGRERKFARALPSFAEKRSLV